MAIDGRRLAARVATGAEAVVALLAALVLLLAGTAFALERTGWLDARLREELERRTAAGVAFDRVRIDWRRPALVVENVRLARAPHALAIGRIAVEPHLGEGPWWQLVASGGGVRVGPALERELSAVLRAVETSSTKARDPDDAVRWPAVTWTGAAVAIARPAGRARPLGSLDLWLRPAGDGAALTGLARPRLREDGPALEPLALRGELGPEGVLEAALAVRHLEVPPGALAEELWLADSGVSGLSGHLTLSAQARVPLGGGEPSAELDVALEGLAWESEDPLFAARDARVRGRLAFHPRAGGRATDADAWSGEWRVSAHWNDGPIDVGVLVGQSAGPGKLARLDLVVPSAPLGSDVTLRTARECTGPNTGRAIADAWAALEPGGMASLVLAGELDVDPPKRAVRASDDDEDKLRPRVHFHVDLGGTAALRYAGWPQDRGGVQGFPVPLSEVDGKLVFSHEPGDLRRDRFGLIDVSATPPSGAVRARGSILSREPDWPGREPEIRLGIDIEDLAVETDVATGLAGLDLGFDPLGPWNARGGTASGELGFEQHPRNDGMLLALDVRFAGLGGDVAEHGIALRGGAGGLALRFAREELEGDDGDEHRPAGVAFALSAALDALGEDAAPPDAEALGPRGAVRGTWRELAGGADARDPSLAVELAVDDAALDGAEVRSFARARGLGALADRFADALEGAVGLRASLAEPAGPAPGHVALHVAAPTVAAEGLLPWPLEGWRVDGNVRGDVDPLAWLGSDEAAGDETGDDASDDNGGNDASDDINADDTGGAGDAADAAADDDDRDVGDGGAREPVWHVHARAAGEVAARSRGALVLRTVDGVPLVDFAAAGVDPASPRLRAELARIAGAPDVADADDDGALLPAGLALEGRFDLNGTLAAGESGPEPYVAIDLRHGRLTVEGLVLEALTGRLALAGGSIGAARLDTRYGDAALALEDLSLWLRDDDGTWRATPAEPHPAGADATALLRTRLSFVDVPVDSVGLAKRDTETVAETAPETVPEDELGPAWRGELDAHGVQVDVAIGGAGPVAWISGEVVPHDVRILTALPIGISSARVQLERVVVEGGDARGWGRVDGLYANVAGRAIEDGSLVATYAAGRLTVDDLVAGVAGGTVSALGAPASGDDGRTQGGRALAVDLVEGGRFELGLALSGLQVRQLLEGLVARDQTTSGRVDGELRISGVPRDPASLQGSGRLSIDRARLGSIPVARAVFTALGFDATATFDRGVARFTLRDAVLGLDELVVRSPLLKLVGDGTIGLDGRLAVDLDVEYGIVDALGAFGSIVYWLQNQLLRVSVRGDMARPSVRVRNVLIDLVGDGTKDLPLLPLPTLPPLPPRF